MTIWEATKDFKTWTNVSVVDIAPLVGVESITDALNIVINEPDRCGLIVLPILKTKLIGYMCVRCRQEENKKDTGV